MVKLRSGKILLFLENYNKLKKQKMLDDILYLLKTIKDDEEKLTTLHDFMLDEFSEDEENDEADNKIEIPEKFQKLIREIAQSIDADMVCYLNTDNLELITIPKGVEDYYSEDELDELWGDMIKKVNSLKNKLVFNPLYSHESFPIMESFANSLVGEKFQEKLYHILSRKKPFANFNRLVHDSDYSEDWFAFKEEYIMQLVATEMNDNELLKA